MRVIKVLIMVGFVLFLFGCRNEEADPYDIVLNSGQDTINLGDTWVDGGAKLLVGNEDVLVPTKDTVDGNTMGLYEIEYFIVYEGLDYTIKRYVMVTDLEAPVGTLNPGIDTIHVNETWIDEGIEVTDNVDTQVTVTVTNLVDETVIGTYHVVYRLEDDYGNVSYVTRVVTVIE